MGANAQPQVDPGAQLIMDYYVPLFVKTCAERGLRIQTEEELAEHIKDAHILRAYEEHQDDDLLKQASTTLRDNLTPGWREQAAKQAAVVTAHQSASELLSGNPDLREASRRVLGLGGA